MESYNDNQAAGQQPAAVQPQPQPQHQAAQHAPPQGQKKKLPMGLIFAAVAVIAVIAAAGAYLGTRGGGTSTTTVQQNAGGPTLGSLLTITNSSNDISLSYSGSTHLSVGANSTSMPFAVTIGRSGRTSSISVVVQNTTLEMFRFGSLYYDCLVNANGLRTCYNETTVVANYSTSALYSAALLLSQLANTSTYSVSTSQRAYSGRPCTFLTHALNASGATSQINGCVSGSLGILMNLSIYNYNGIADAASEYSVSLSRLSSSSNLSALDQNGIAASSKAGIQSQELAYDTVYALDAPISVLDTLVLPGEVVNLIQIGTFGTLSLTPQACSPASPEFECAGAGYTKGVLTFTFGQASGSQWSNTIVYFVPAGSSLTADSPSFAIGNALSGQSIPVLMSVPGNALTGNQLVGTIYGTYSVSGAAQNATEIAILALNTT